MSTLLWAVRNRRIIYKTETFLANHSLNRLLNTNRTALSNLVLGFVPPLVSSNLEMSYHQAPSASSSISSNRQWRATSMAFHGALQQSSRANVVQFPENGEHSLQPQPQLQPQQQKASSSGSQVNSDRYKTELCRPFEESGVCRYGHKCQFAHGQRELRTLTRHPKYKTEPCRTFHTTGFCPYGSRCHFIHNQPAQQPVPSMSASGEPSSSNSSNEQPLGFNGVPQPRLQRARNSGFPPGLVHALQAPPLLNHPVLSPRRMLPSPYAAALPVPVAPVVPMAPMAPVPPNVAAMFIRSGGVPFAANCANNAFTYGQEMGGFFAPATVQQDNFANATAYNNSQQLGLAASEQFPMPIAAPRPAAPILAQAGVAPAAAAAFAPGAAAAAFAPEAAAAAFAPGAAAAAAAIVAPGTAASATVGLNNWATAAGIDAEGPATAVEDPEQHFSVQLPGDRPESPDFDVVSRTLDSLFNEDGRNNLLSSSSSSPDDTETRTETRHRRLPIFSRLSESTKK